MYSLSKRASIFFFKMRPRLKRYQYMKMFQEVIGPSNAWPNKIRFYLYGNAHLNNQQRFTVVVFLMANGINPELIMDFM